MRSIFYKSALSVQLLRSSIIALTAIGLTINCQEETGRVLRPTLSRNIDKDLSCAVACGGSWPIPQGHCSIPPSSSP